MSLRFQAINNLTNEPLEVKVEGSTKITAIFGENVFTLKTAREYLSDEAYKSLVASIKGSKKIERAVANQIANGIRAWAESKGVTHFTHWFQPLTGATAEKHDSFFTIKSDGTTLEEFDGAALIQQEPDASSFPSGGLRATFEARGYTAWDPSSPAFVMEIGQGKTLCIPTIFVSYTGESLDYKAPLLKALEALNKAAVDVCNYFDKNVTKVTATLGWEQEYFVIDEGLANARPDLVQCGRTVFGAAPAKGQQLEDHYFGSIPERVYAFMRDYEEEGYRLGIPLRTRHNEVAPSQFECAPIFEEVNLLAPGKTPKTNLMFLTFFVNTIKAVHDYADVLRASIASAPNDHRLGANEAPPAIISVFIGQYLTKVLQDVKERVSEKMDEQDESMLKIDIHKSIPELLMDNTDRNRTSPFAFTGNKFEFRAVGSSANCANAMTLLIAAVADALRQMTDRLAAKLKGGGSRDQAVLDLLREVYQETAAIRFEGNNYSDQWRQEAARRGLPNLADTPAAIAALQDPRRTAFLRELGVLSERELASRLTWRR